MKEKYEDAGIIKTGHFLLSSGRHSNQYINKDAIYASKLFRDTIMRLVEECDFLIDDSGISIDVDIITGPAVAGAVLAAPVWLDLCTHFNHKHLTFVYPEKVRVPYDYFCHGEPHTGYNEVMQFRRGYDKVIKNKRVLIVEDIITTGSSVMKTFDAIKECGGHTVAVVCIWNRTNWHAPAGIPITSLVNEPVESWTPDECPLCKSEYPLTDPKE